MKKIYITSLHMRHGGVEMAITLLANALDKMGYRVEILCTYHLGEPVYRLNEGVQIKYLTDVHPNREEFKAAVKSKNPIKILKEAVYSLQVLWLKRRSLIKEFKKIESGTIISTRNEHSVLLSHYGKPGVKKIAQLHHDHKFDKNLMRDFKKNYGDIDYFVLLTDLLKEEIEQMLQENLHTKCVAIPNFLDQNIEQPHLKRERQVITVGRLHSVKGFDRLIQMWREVDFSEPTVLKIVGDGEEREYLERLIKEYHLENKILMTGPLEHDQVMKEMKKSLCYVMTSYSEAFPFVLIEAMEQGLPAVAFDVRVGPRTIIENGKSGFLIPECEPQHFLEKVKLLVEDTVVRQQMSDAAVCRSEDFTETKVIQKWISILEA